MQLDELYHLDQLLQISAVSRPIVFLVLILRPKIFSTPLAVKIAQTKNKTIQKSLQTKTGLKDYITVASPRAQPGGGATVPWPAPLTQTF